jgi:Repeat of unknown function (DUF5648)/Papain-like cysteine protease AvrRpt2
MTSHFYTADATERQNAINHLGYADEGIGSSVFNAPPDGPAPLYRAYHAPTDAHFYTMSLAERDNATNKLGFTAEGITGYIFGPQHPGATPLYRAYRAASDDHFYTTNVTEHNNAVQHLGYTNEGITGYVLAAAAPGAVPLYRLVKTTHFYTADAAERQNAIQHLGFTDEGIACYIFNTAPAGPGPLYRVYHPTTLAHFYTMSITERDNATNKLGYTAEGIACYIDRQQQPGTVPLYRAYQGANDDHFYTTNLAEHNNAVQHLGYVDEGVTGYVPATAVPNGHAPVPFYRLFGPNATRYLYLIEQYQQQTNWCWAATTVSITKYYDAASPWTQCLLVNKALGMSTCCQNGSTTACNQGWYGDKALSITGHLAGTSSGAPSLSTVKDQINALRPISIAIYWNGGGGHNPAVDGYNTDTNPPTIDIQDPWYGHSTQDFNTFPASYHGGANWGYSFFTK